MNFHQNNSEVIKDQYLFNLRREIVEFERLNTVDFLVK